MQSLLAQLSAATANSPIIGSATSDPIFAVNGGSGNGRTDTSSAGDPNEALA